MAKTFSLRRLFIRYALSLFVLPVLLWTGTLATVHHHAHAVTGVTLSVYATGHVKKESVQVQYAYTCNQDMCGASTQCLSFSPNKRSQPLSLPGDIYRLTMLHLYLDSANCSSTPRFVTIIGLHTKDFNSGKACTFDYRRNLLSGCVKPARHYKTSPYQQGWQPG
jgi:hypothetical protein